MGTRINEVDAFAATRVLKMHAEHSRRRPLAILGQGLKIEMQLLPKPYGRRASWRSRTAHALQKISNPVRVRQHAHLFD